MQLADWVAVVVGGTEGIGKACAMALGAAGAAVAVCEHSFEAGEDVAAQIRAAGGDAAFLPVDVADEASVEALGVRFTERFRRLAVAANSPAAPVKGARLAEEVVENFVWVFEVNVRGPWLALRMELRLMLAGGRGGSIVNVGSMAGSPERSAGVSTAPARTRSKA